jgi:hypothetical protein
MTDRPNSRVAVEGRRDAGALDWTGPAAMLFARSIFAVLAYGVAVAALSLAGAASPWVEARTWFPIYATLIDAGCLALLYVLTRREGARLVDLLSFDRRRLGRDLLLGVVLVAPSLVFILGGIAAGGLVVYGTTHPAAIFAPLPLPAALYAVLVFPVLWGFVEQMTYNGYLARSWRGALWSRSRSWASPGRSSTWSCR